MTCHSLHLSYMFLSVAESCSKNLCPPVELVRLVSTRCGKGKTFCLFWIICTKQTQKSLWRLKKVGSYLNVSYHQPTFWFKCVILMLITHPRISPLKLKSYYAGFVGCYCKPWGCDRKNQSNVTWVFFMLMPRHMPETAKIIRKQENTATQYSCS